MPIVLSPPSERLHVPLTVRLAALGRSRKRTAIAASAVPTEDGTMVKVSFTPTEVGEKVLVFEVPPIEN